MRRRTWWSVLLALAGALAVVSILEVSLRLFWESDRLAREMRTKFFRVHPGAGLTHAPNAVIAFPFPEHPRGKVVFRTNNLGLREDADTRAEKVAGTFRILAVGDSHTDGVVYNEESYANRLERSYATVRVAGVEVLNAGVGMTNQLLQLRWLREFGRGLALDLVIVGAYVGNDVVELLVFDDPILCEGRPGCGAVAPRATKLDHVKEWVPRDLALYHLVANGVRATPIADWLHAVGLMGYKYQPLPERAARICEPCVWQALYQAYVARAHPAEMRRAFETTEVILREFDDEARRMGARLALVVIPTRRQVEPEEDVERVQRATSALGLSGDEAAFDHVVRRRLLGFAATRGIPALDLYPVFRSAYLETRQPLYWRADWHLNVEGHRLAARALRAFLLGRGLGPRGRSQG